MNERPQFNETFRKEAVTHWISSGRPAHIVAEELGIRPHLLYSWRKRYAPPAAAGGRAAAGGAKPPSPAQLEAELAAAQREIRHLREQRDILKKTLGIVSQPLPGDTNSFTP
jgi:transposase